MSEDYAQRAHFDLALYVKAKASPLLLGWRVTAADGSPYVEGISKGFGQAHQLRASCTLGAATSSPTVIGGFLVTVQVGSATWARAA